MWREGPQNSALQPQLSQGHYGTKGAFSSGPSVYGVNHQRFGESALVCVGGWGVGGGRSGGL